MRLLLMRHGQAEPAHMGTDRDHLRALTEFGAQEVMDRACSLKSIMDQPIIVHSPFLRAQQTAELLHVHTGWIISHAWTALQPESDPVGLESWCRDQQHDLVLVAHMPLLGLLCARLLDEPGQNYPLVTAGVHELHMLEPQGSGVFRLLRTYG